MKSLKILVILMIFFLITGCVNENQSNEEKINNKIHHPTKKDSINIEHFYDDTLSAEYWITTISPKDKNSLKSLINKSFAFSDDSVFKPLSKENPLTHALRLKSRFAINASGWNENTDKSIVGVQIKDGEVYQNSSKNDKRWYTLGIDNKGIMNVFPSSVTGETLVNNYNIKNTFSFSIPIIINGKEVDQSIYDAYSPSFKTPYPRQIIGQVYDTNEIIILTVDGKTHRSHGLTLPQCVQILLKRNCRVAYNLDGGGSVQTIYKGKLINHPSDGGIRDTSDLLYIK